MGITFDNLSFKYSENLKPLVDKLGWSVDRRAITVLTGASGCGKSTLLYLAAGLYPENSGIITTGHVLIEGKDPAKLNPPERCRLVGMMFQNPELQFCMDTVRNEILFCLENIAIPQEEMEEKLRFSLDFCGIRDLENRALLSLSGGEKQKAALACVVAISPEWVLLDEPFANIDDMSARSIAAALGKLHKEKGVGILAVDHRLDNWIGIADNVAIMKDGRIIPEEIDVRNANPEKLRDLGIIAPGVHYAPSIPQPTPSDIVLEFHNLKACRGKKEILHGISASFRRGMIYAIIGESGSGKSTLFGALSGIFPYSGKALLDGKDIKHLKRSEAGMIGFITQNPQDQFVGGTVRDEILSSLRKDPEAASKSEEILRAIKLWRYRDISPYLLSQGQQRRLGTAALIVYDCHCLVCDEPTYAQDLMNTMAIMNALCQEARERNIALIFSTHDRQLAADYADEILTLKEGQLYADSESCL